MELRRFSDRAESVFQTLKLNKSQTQLKLSSAAITRVGGNKKGVFTRNRQPKEVAHILRRRYFALAKELDMFGLPEDLTVYISKHIHNEL